MSTAAVDIRPLDLLDPTQQRVAEEWVDVFSAVQRELFGDSGSPYSLAEMQAFHRAPSRLRIDRAAYLSGELVGAAQVVMSTSDNLDSAFIRLSVRPGHRGRDVGSALLAEAERVAREHGRTIFQVETEWAFGGNDLGEEFALRHGYAVGQTLLRSSMTLRDTDASVLESILRRPGAGDYDLESFLDRMPEPWLAQRAVLQQRMSTDAPSDDLDIEEEAWDVERMRRSLAVMRESGRRIVETVARHVPTGDLVGFTQVTLPVGAPALAYQQDTLVLTEHRGHALGLRLKAANALLLMRTAPDLQSVRTWNSSTNEHMLAVNRELGYVVDGYSREWQKRLS